MTKPQENVIETTDLVKIYKEGKIKAVDKLNLRIGRGEIYALIGANGSGNVTTYSMSVDKLCGNGFGGKVSFPCT